jgi:hypothetical protein
MHVLMENPDLSEEDEWGHPWLDFARNLPDMRGRDLPELRDDNDNAERIEWIDEAARAFARDHDFSDPQRLAHLYEEDNAS